MTWVKLSERRPETIGYYNVVRYYPGFKIARFSKPEPPRKQIEYLLWNQKMKLEEEYADRCVYKKYDSFVTEHDMPVDRQEILYWYELDPIPEEQ
jgi:hypothetical protein